MCIRDPAGPGARRVRRQPPPHPRVRHQERRARTVVTQPTTSRRAPTTGPVRDGRITERAHRQSNLPSGAGRAPVCGDDSGLPGHLQLGLGWLVAVVSNRCRLLYHLRMHADSRKSDDDLPIEQAELAVEVFRMLSDTTRVRLLWALTDQELAVNELAAVVSKPAPSVSQHLAKLRMARLVRTRREGTQVFYRLENEHVARLVRDGVYNAKHAGTEDPRHHVDDGTAPLSSLPRSRSRGQG